MPLITLRQLLDHAAEREYAVPAFNVNNMEQVLAVVAAADGVDAPAIVQVSRGARRYAGEAMLTKLVEGALQMYPTVPVCLHQDHGNSAATCLSAIRWGFTSVMMDGSLLADGRTPSDYDYNVAVTGQVVEAAHAVGASVEGELGVLGSLETGTGEAEDGHGAAGALDRDQLVTDPDQAVAFVAATGVDALAIAMGTSHGAYKFSRRPDGDILALDVVRQIHARLPATHLVMHGSSSVPQELLDVFNAHGGAIPQTYGVPVDQIQAVIPHGVRKVNIDTDTRLAIVGQWRRIAAERPAEFDPRAFLAPSIEAMTALCKQRYEEFGTAGQAPRIGRIATLDEMAARYATGELAPETVAALEGTPA